jgi:hypothetical protein
MYKKSAHHEYEVNSDDSCLAHYDNAWTKYDDHMSYGNHQSSV